MKCNKCNCFTMSLILGWCSCRYSICINYCNHFCKATGNGEKLMQYCPSYQVVEAMKKGYTPQEACEYTIKNMIGSGEPFEAGLIAINNKVNNSCCF